MNRIVDRELIVIIIIVALAIMAMSLLQPVLPIYLASIGISPATLGLMLSTGMFGMLLGESAGGWLADRAGIRVPMFIGTFFCAPLVLSFIVIRDTALMFVVFFLWGIVRAAIFGPGRGYIGTNIPVSHKATFMAIFATAMAISGSLGAFASGFIADTWGYDRDFMIAAGIGLLGGILTLIGLSRQTSQKATQVTLAAPAAPSAPTVALYRNKSFIIQSAIATLRFTAIGVLPFLSLLAVQVVGLTVSQVGVLFTIIAFGSAVLLIPMGRLADRTSKRMMMTVGLVVVAISLIVLAFSRNFLQLAVGQVIGSIGGAMFGPAAVALLSENVPAQRQSTAMGIYGGCEDAGVIVGSALGGVVWTALGPAPTFLLIGATSAILAAVMAFALLKKRTA